MRKVEGQSTSTVTFVGVPDIRNSVMLGDCLELMKEMPDNSVDLVFGSPPYVDARTYGIGFNLRGQDWVDWMVPRVEEALRICKGLVAFVVQGKTKNFRWNCTPALLIADLHRKGICVRNPPIYHRIGIPGSGGPDWWRSDYEWVVCCTKGGKLPWSDNTATGKPPKFPPGGAPRPRLKDGDRAGRKYRQPELANPGNVVFCGAVGGGNIGDRMASENEAPFPEKLAHAFVVSFCPPGGVVLDPFCGSGTTLKMATSHGRYYIGMDIRDTQVELSNRRVNAIRQEHTSVSDEPLRQ